MISFPRRMPTVGTVGIQFEPDRADFLAPEASGRLGAISAGFPRWVMKITLGAMRLEHADTWRAWLSAQRGSQRQFIGFDADRQLPRAYRDGRPFRPSPSGWSQAINADGVALLTLTGLLPGQVVAAVDYIGFSWGADRLALTRSIMDAVANAGGVAVVPVEPALAPVVPATARATLVQAGCLMRLVPGETKLGESGLGIFSAGSTISAVQDIIA